MFVFIVWGLYTGSTYLRGGYAAVFPPRNLAARRLRVPYLLISGYAGGYAGATRKRVGKGK